MVPPEEAWTGDGPQRAGATFVVKAFGIVAGGDQELASCFAADAVDGDERSGDFGRGWP